MSFLEVRNIYKNFGGTEVIKGVSLDVERGEIISMIGSSGGGKTTLLRCLNLLELPDVGTITVDGHVIFDGQADRRISEPELRSRRLHFGLVFQQYNLFPQYSVYDNICLAPRLLARERPDFRQNKKVIFDEIGSAAEALLARVGLSDKRNSYPCELSGGQQQRVAIARALALKPDILCFDEPTSALDPELTGEVLSVIKGLKNGDTTMIIVTHEMNFARNVSDRVIFLADGVIAEEGAPEQIFGSPSTPALKAFLSKAQEN